MQAGHYDYGNGYHGRAYLNPHQLFLHPSTIWRLAQDLLDVLPGELLERTEVVAGPATGGALLAHTMAGLLDGRRALTHPPCSFAPFTYVDGELSLRSFYASHLDGRRVLLADDVRNTGKTFERCATLVAAGRRHGHRNGGDLRPARGRRGRSTCPTTRSPSIRRRRTIPSRSARCAAPGNRSPLFDDRRAAAEAKPRLAVEPARLALYARLQPRGLGRRSGAIWSGRSRDREDREIAGFCAAALAFGRVASVLASIATLFRISATASGGVRPRVRSRRAAPGARAMVHRWTRGVDLAALLWILRQMLEQSGSVERFFAEGSSEGTSSRRRARRFSRRALALDMRRVYGRVPKRAGVCYFFPRPSAGSACKRLNLYLRWMVRRDEVDLGVWRAIRPATADRAARYPRHPARALPAADAV